MFSRYVLLSDKYERVKTDEISLGIYLDANDTIRLGPMDTMEAPKVVAKKIDKRLSESYKIHLLVSKG